MSKKTWKLAKGKTWNGKLREEHPNHGKVVKISPAMQKRFGKGTMVIPKPLAMNALVQSVRKGKLVTMSQLRDRLAADSGADHACPMTSGIFFRIVAEAAEENLRAGKKRVTPYWRVIRDDGSLNDKCPGGVNGHAKHLRGEGMKIKRAARGKRLYVEDFERRLVDL